MLRDTRFDFLDNPAFGIPVLGHVLNIPSFLAALAASQIPAITPEDSEAMQIAREEGIMKSWQQREDIGWLPKLAAETALSAFMPGIGFKGPGASLTKSLTRPALSRFREAQEIAPTLNLKTFLRDRPWAASAQPFVNKLPNWLVAPFEESPQARYQWYIPHTKQLLSEFSERKLNPDEFIAFYNELINPVKYATKEEAQAARKTWKKLLKVGEPNLAFLEMPGSLIDLEERYQAFPPAKGDKKIANNVVGTLWKEAKEETFNAFPDLPEEALKEKSTEQFYGRLSSLIDSLKYRETKSWQGKNSPLFPIFQFFKQLMLSSGAVLPPNQTDIFIKNKVMGIPNKEILLDTAQAFRSLPNILRQTNPDEALTKFLKEKVISPQMKNYLEREELPAWLEASIGTDIKNKNILGNFPLKETAAVGGALGGIGGGPIGVPLGALGALLTRYGSQFTTSGMRIQETIARAKALLEGGRRYFKEPELLEGISSTAFTNNLDELKRIASKQGKNINDWQEIDNFLSSQDYLVGPKGFEEFLKSLKTSNNRRKFSKNKIDNMTDLWRDMHEESILAGINLTNKTYFPYSQDSNLIHALRSVTPFPVWPARNLPFYTEQLIQRPWIASLIANTRAKAEGNEENLDLPLRFFNRLPLAPLPNGSLYGNPLAPLSISTQLNEPPASSSLSRSSGLETINELGNFLGFGLAPWVNMPAQSLGIVSQKQDFPDISPWSRPIKSLGQILGMQNFEPEAAIKAPFAAVRNALAPSTTPNISYQDYLARKKLAEMSINKTGKPWWDNVEFMEAMLDPNNPLYQEANRNVGMEQLALFGARRVMPLQLAYLPREEEMIRRERASLPERSIEASPLSQGYKNISMKGENLKIKAKLDFYYRLPPSAQEAFLQANPDLRKYLEWKNREEQQNLRPNISAYLDQ